MRFFLYFFLVVFASTNSYAKPMTQRLWNGITQKEVETVKQVSILIDRKNYDEALALVAKIKDDKEKNAESKNEEKEPEQNHELAEKFEINSSFRDAMIDLILWKKFSEKIDPQYVSFSDISRFVNDHPFYPNINELRKNAEKVAVVNNVPFVASEQYFKSNPANSLESKIYLLQSKIDFLSRLKTTQDRQIKARQEIQELATNIWVKENFSKEEEEKFLTKYQNQLNEISHIDRIRRLLWEGKINDANRIMNFVNDDYKKLFSAAEEIQNSPKYLDKIILSVPRKLRSDELLVYRKIMWYKSKDRLEDLIDAMISLPKETKFSEKWWSLRRLYAREMIKQKEYKIAYRIVSNHFLPTKSSDFWEAEWTAGWIALRFLDRPKDAYQHFETLYKNVSQPVTLSRAAYWLGMSAYASRDKQKAVEWYKIAAKYPIFFYGQLAIHKHRMLDSTGAQSDIILPKDPDITLRDVQNISKSVAAKIAYLLAITGDKESATKVFEYIVNNAQTEGQIAVIMKVINEIGDRQMDAKVARAAARKNVFFIRDKFQIVKEVESDEYAPLVHAVIKQESGFAPTAVSQVGAIGFMQLMPATAKLVAKEVGVKYDKQKLATDIKYNVRLGSHYIKKLIDRFDGSEMLAIASYNAGPNATQRWINEFYDPRKEKDLDRVVDWIELITYSETRNYVQRIMENLIVYKYLMSRPNYDDVK